jgi:hypothetical protein
MVQEVQDGSQGMNDADTVDRLPVFSTVPGPLFPTGWVERVPRGGTVHVLHGYLEAIGNSMQRAGGNASGMLSLLVSVLGKRRYVAQSSVRKGPRVPLDDANALDVPHAFYLAMDWKGTPGGDNRWTVFPIPSRKKRGRKRT